LSIKMASSMAMFMNASCVFKPSKRQAFKRKPS
jgi:hypothetical protein